MKRIYSIAIFAAVALAAAVSCTDDRGVETPEREGLVAVLDADAPATKAIMIDKPGVKVESFWEGGDNIGVFGNGGSNVKFSVAAADISADGKTAFFTATTTTPSGSLTSYFPYQDGASADGSKVRFTFPAVQHHTLVGGVAQADPAAAIKMGTGTRGGGLSFRNAFAILKIGQVFQSATTVKSLEFRDLSGAAVCGEAEMEWSDGSPTAVITGSGKVITLDCGDGVTLDAGSLGVFFLVVPAREYAKGFEITFVAADGSKTVRKAGSVQGKTVSRGVVYMIGDVSSVLIPAEGTTSELYPTAMFMDPEALDLFTVTSIYNEYVYDENGNQCYDINGIPMRRPQIVGIAHKDLNPVEGGWMIFTEPTEDLPDGGVYRIDICAPLDPEHYEVVLKAEQNIAAPFKEMTAGDPIYDAAGNYIESGGVELDLAGALAEIITDDGKSVPFSVSRSGDILFTPEAAAMLFEDHDIIVENEEHPETKAIFSKGISTPKVSLSLHGDNAEAMFGASLNLHMKAAAKMRDGELHYIHFTANPKLNLSADFSVSAKAELSETLHLLTLRFVPIAIAPGVLMTPRLEISGKIGVGAEIKFSTSLSYTHDLGRFGFSYLKGDGFTGRHSIDPPLDPPSVEPSVTGTTGTLYAFGSLVFTPYIGLYGLLGVSLDSELKLQLSLEYGEDSHHNATVRKMYLAPALELTPSIASLGGWFTHKFEELSLKVDFDAFWEQYLDPEFSFIFVSPKLRLSKEFYQFTYGESGKTISQVYTGISDVDYEFVLKHSIPVACDLYLYEYLGTPKYVASPGHEGELADAIASGAPNIFGSFHGYLKSEEPEYSGNRQLLGRYEAGVDSCLFKGTLNFDGASGKAVTYMPVLIREGEAFYYGWYTSSPVVYYWPNDSNGYPYVPEDTDDDD